MLMKPMQLAFRQCICWHNSVGIAGKQIMPVVSIHVGLLAAHYLVHVVILAGGVTKLANLI